jgi:hypothetical protein
MRAVIRHTFMYTFVSYFVKPENQSFFWPFGDASKKSTGGEAARAKAISTPAN